MGDAVRGCQDAARYRFGLDPQVADLRCGRHRLVYRPVAGRTIRVALVVGTVLTAINQGAVLLGGQLTALVAA
jgi:hypothetical protein